MRKNNFVRAAEGQPDIESFCFYDTWQSQVNFKENFKIVKDGGRFDNLTLYYIDYGNVKDDSGITFTLEGSEESLNRYLAAYYGGDISEWSPEDKKEWVLNNGYSLTLANFESESECLKAEYGLTIKPSKDLVKVISCGYSQGDYAEIWYCPKDLEDAWGIAPEESKLKETFDRLLWDAPVSARFEIDGKEFNYHEVPNLENEYEWNRDAYLDYVAKESGIERETLESFVPEYPSYN